MKSTQTIHMGSRKPLMNLSDVLLHPDEYDGETVANPWSQLLGEDFLVLHVSVFGNFFLTDKSARIWLLDSWGGQLHGVSHTYDEFKALINSDIEFFRSWFLVELLETLHSQGFIRGKGQVFSPFVSPSLGGSLAPANFTIAPLQAHVASSAREAFALKRTENQ